MLSFWERDALLEYDYIVVGSGIVGLSTAIALRARRRTASILVVERGLLPTGASTKNAGFACYGSLSEVLSDIERNDADTALALIENRVRGLQMLRQRLGDTAIGYEEHGGYELLFEEGQRYIDSVDEVNQVLEPVLGERYFSVCQNLIPTFGFNTHRVQSLIAAPREGQIHTGKMMRALADYARNCGIAVMTGAEVLSIEPGGSGVLVELRGCASSLGLVLRAEQVAVCANAWASTLLPNLCVKPGRGQVLLTTPIAELGFQGVFHFHEGFYYFRNIDSRVLFGGGRNLAIEEEETRTLATTERIQGVLEELLRDVILPGKPFEIEMRWAGIMAFSENKLPIVKQVASGVTVGFGCNGMGVALGSAIGQQTAEAMVEGVF